MDEAIDYLLDSIEEIIASGETLPDELIDEIIEILIGYAEELSSQEQIPVDSNVTPAPYPSSNIYGFNYDPESNKLLVKFMGKDVAAGGPEYSYEGVPPYIFDIFKRGAVAPKTSGSNRWHTWKRGVTPSHGAAMSALIKAGGFPYKKVA